MSEVGVRELKNRLSRYLKRVQAGEEVIVTEHGRTIARLVPVKVPAIQEALRPLLQDGHIRWAGGKPHGVGKPPKVRGRSLSELVIEDRR
ncbi:MAG TPA: type II toxin-antitoxin system prevent-host-death family antitoxin [Nitrospiraceae bacterium]|nr:type II toxin-antitoxin system prevent-host-death family antitoxin [Nitrospiraceae bacterium]